MNDTSPASGKLDWLAGVATMLSIGACYGTLLVVAALSLLGIGLSVKLEPRRAQNYHWLSGKNSSVRPLPRESISATSGSS